MKVFRWGSHETGVAGTELLRGSRWSYALETLRGGGGFATTYRGRIVETGTMVLVKELRLDRAESWKCVELFEREARILRELRHPAIPAFVESFVADTTRDAGAAAALTLSAMRPGAAKGAPSRYIIVQELVPGPTLAERIADFGPLSPSAALRLLEEILGVLVYLHGQSPPLVHRDLTPNNIILGADGHARVIDFGSVQARATLEEAAGSTMVGTAGYMPLEQIMGNTRPATDLYALGMSIVFALTGRAPSEISIDEHTGRVRLEAVFAATATELPANLVSALRGMVEPHVGNRLSSAAAVLAALSGPAPVPVLGSAAPTTSLNSAGRSESAQRAVRASSLLAAGCLLFTAFIALSFLQRPTMSSTVVDVPPANPIHRSRGSNLIIPLGGPFTFATPDSVSPMPFIRDLSTGWLLGSSPVVTSSTDGRGGVASSLVDGNSLTGLWSDDHPAFPQYLTMKWYSPQDFDTVALESHFARVQAPTDWDIEVSRDGVAGWQRVASSGHVSWLHEDSTVELFATRFPAVASVRGMRIVIRGANLRWSHYFLTEVLVQDSRK